MKYFITVICLLTLFVSILNANCVKDCCLGSLGCKLGGIAFKEYISNPTPAYSVNKIPIVLPTNEISMLETEKLVILSIIPSSVISEQIKLAWYAVKN